jgi:UDP-N-acetylglucosamine--N-acetylmuramyl-(pentapeptide) pyrophosphoryl-undecaprenol N-acetylglucosamine transferase
VNDLRVVIAGGGTGGHLFPALAIAGEIRRRQPEAIITFVGTQRGIESRIVPNRGYPLEFIDVVPFYRTRIWRNLAFPWKLLCSLSQCLSLMKRHNPHLVIGTGGYVSGPVLFAAALRKIPRAIQEQNAFPGWTTRMLAPRVQQVHLGFDEARKYLRGKATIRCHGNPVASASQDPSRQEVISRWGLNPELPTVLVTGGSQGARSLNRAVQGVCGELLSFANLVWQTGKNAGIPEFQSLEGVPGKARVQEFFDPMNEAYAVADLAVSRSGALTIAELTLRGIPAVLIPYPHAAAGHQEWNAKALVNAGGATMIFDAELSGHRLAKAIKEILSDSYKLSQMHSGMTLLAKPDALSNIVTDLLSLSPLLLRGGIEGGSF